MAGGNKEGAIGKCDARTFNDVACPDIIHRVISWSGNNESNVIPEWRECGGKVISQTHLCRRCNSVQVSSRVINVRFTIFPVNMAPVEVSLSEVR